MWNVRIAAFCLMPNHYHLLVQTPDGNLSPFMRHVDGVYTQRFNRHIGWTAPLFRGGYKAMVVVEAERYLLELVRYIHRNPVRAGPVGRVDRYRWSSECAYRSGSRQWAWPDRSFVLSPVGEEGGNQRRAHRQFMAKDFKEFIRICGMTYVRTSPYYPQSNGKIERWHGTLKRECIRPGTSLSVEEARRLVGGYVNEYNTVRLHSPIGYVMPKDKLEGRAQEIFQARDRKLEAAREARKVRRQSGVDSRGAGVMK